MDAYLTQSSVHMPVWLEILAIEMMYPSQASHPEANCAHLSSVSDSNFEQPGKC